MASVPCVSYAPARRDPIYQAYTGTAFVRGVSWGLILSVPLWAIILTMVF